MEYKEIVGLIDKNSKEYKLASEEDAWHWESLENECLFAIFEYCDSIGLKIDGYDLRKILDADEDDNEGVLPQGIIETLFTIQERIIDPNASDFIQAPKEVKELFKYYKKSFWPLYYD